MKSKWNYDTCKEAALKCKTRGEYWKKYSMAAKKSIENGWLDDFFYKNTIKPRGYWTKEKCCEESKKYKYYTEFRDNSFVVYDKCVKNDWLKDFNWLIDNRKKYDKTSKIHLIYVYIFKDLNYAYVGRTIQLKQRHYTHTKKNNTNDSVMIFIKNNNITNVDMPLILEEKLTLLESKEKEIYWINEYKKMGYNMINKVKGGSIGGLAIKWTKEKCFNEAKKYNKKFDFYKNNSSAWIAARKNGWLKDYTWLTSTTNGRNYWTYEKCLECAKKSSSSSYMENNYFQAYRKARIMGWLKDYTWFKRPIVHNKKYTYDFCKEEIIKYNKISDMPMRMVKSIKDNNWYDLIKILENIKKGAKK